MPRVNEAILRFNAGEISRLAVGRVDLERMPFSAAEQVNWVPRALGSMMLRPGLAYLGSTHNDQKARILSFVRSTLANGRALLELTPNLMRVWVNDAPISRVAVSTAVTSGDFSSATGWTLTATDGATSAVSGGVLNLTALARGSSATAKQQVTVTGGDQGKEHALRIIIIRGPVLFRCGSTDGGDEYISEATLATGAHSLAFTPTGNFWVQFQNRDRQLRIVDSITVEAVGVMTLSTPWGANDIPLVRDAQSADVLFVACDGFRQRRVERRGERSWSLVEYYANDGPFTDFRTAEVRLKPSVNEGNGTLTADVPFFQPGHVGALFRLFHEGQVQTIRLAADGVETPAIRITGIVDTDGDPDDRNFGWTRAGTWVGTCSLQRSYDTDDSGFIQRLTRTGNGSDSVTGDTSGIDNNLVVFYRVAFRDGEYTSGTLVTTLNHDGGGGYGICRVVGYTSPTQVDIEVLQPFWNIQFTDDWREGEWSDVRGWPSAVGFHEGRLFWSGRDKVWGSISDAFEGFDPDFEGDAGPINRGLGSGPIDVINWLLPIQRLLIGTEGSEVSMRSSSFDEPLTPTNVTVKDASTQGSARLPAVKIDQAGLFVQRAGKRVYELRWSGETNDYAPRDLTLLHPDICAPMVADIAVQRQPETRVHFARSDGQVALLMYDPAENIMCWTRVETDGVIEDVSVLPGIGEDQVYYIVQRTIDGQTKRYVEKWAMESEAVGGTVTKIADSHIHYSGVPATVITGLDHLEGREVVIWADGRDAGTATVTGGQITLATAASEVVAGLGYEARYKSVKLAYGAAGGTALTKRKQVNYLGTILVDTHYQGLRFGRDYDHLDPMPLSRDAAPLPADSILAEYDEDAFVFPGSWDTDSRVCLKAAAPRPCNLLALVIDIETNG